MNFQIYQTNGNGKQFFDFENSTILIYDLLLQSELNYGGNIFHLTSTKFILNSLSLTQSKFYHFIDGTHFLF